MNLLQEVTTLVWIGLVGVCQPVKSRAKRAAFWYSSSWLPVTPTLEPVSPNIQIVDAEGNSLHIFTDCARSACLRVVPLSVMKELTVFGGRSGSNNVCVLCR